MNEDEDVEYEEGFDFSPNSDDHQLYWRHHIGSRRRRPKKPVTTESPLKRLLSREITNLERYLPLLARKMGNNHTLSGQIHPQNRHRSTTPIFLPSPTPTTKPANKRRKLVTTTLSTPTTEWIHKQKTVSSIYEISKIVVGFIHVKYFPTLFVFKKVKQMIVEMSKLRQRRSRRSPPYDNNAIDSSSKTLQKSRALQISKNYNKTANYAHFKSISHVYNQSTLR